jgi:hypothetical protein
MRAVSAITRRLWRRFSLAAESACHGVDFAAGHIHHRLSSAQQHRDQHQRQRAGEIDRPPHMLCNLVGTSNQLLTRVLLVGDLLIHNRRISLVLADARIVLTYNRIRLWKQRNASREFGLNLAQIR